PKGVAYEHGMFNAQIGTIQALYDIRPGEIEMPAFPLFALFNVAMGATSAIPDLDPTRPAACDPAKIVEIMNDQGVTSTFGSPAIWNKVTRYCIEHDIRLPQLQRVLMAGAPVPSAIHQRFQNILEAPADTHTPYGATEALPITSISGREALAVQATRADPTAGTCVGRPVPGITLRVITITDQPIERWDERLSLPANQVGEIVVKGQLVTTSYINRPAATRLAKIPEGSATWHRMGDLGYLDDDGRLWFYGRKSHRVQLADTCLYTEPCELVFNQHAAVYRSALVGVRSRDGSNQPVIVIELEAGRQPRSTAEHTRLIGELLALGARAPMTAAITTVLFHPSFPVDIRHNAKIFREKLAVWAYERLRRHQ
ncbi:MAG: fatty acid CoA ligase family protein, partial [Roseiflexaceae bacterium]